MRRAVKVRIMVLLVVDGVVGQGGVFASRTTLKLNVSLGGFGPPLKVMSAHPSEQLCIYAF